MPIRFLHISDIHFRKFVPGKEHWDLDGNIQNEVELDLASFCEKNGSINAILISGDIAFSGAEDEYEIADAWLKKLSKIVGCELEHILTIPGNHDVDRSKVRGMLLNNHKQLRSLKKRAAIDQMLFSVLESDDDAELFFKPFDNYHKFAAKYGSIPENGNKLFWEKSFDLAPLKIRIRGVNSALISNEDDNEHTHKLFVGSHQTNLKRQAGVINIFMCHHPPQWLYDNDELNVDVLAKSSIQLYGHKHKEDIKKINECLVLSAGAMQPSRNEDDWQPCYNIIDLDILLKDSKNFLIVKVWKRALDKNKSLKFLPRFTEQGSHYETFELQLDDIIHHSKPTDMHEKLAILASHPKPKKAVSAEVEQKQIIRKDEPEEEIIDVNKQDYIRKLAYMFLSLPYHKKLKIAVGLDLCAESDEKLPDLQKSQLYIKRAKENNKLKQLWDETANLQPDPLKLPNPF